MLPKTKRVSTATLRTLTGRGFTYHSPLLFLSLYKNTPSKSTQYAVICSKKVSKRAVDRNKLRRQVYKVLSTLHTRIAPGYICIITLKKEVYTMPFSHIQEVLTSLLTHANVLQ